MGTLSYSSNNSGGSWWLSDEDWFAMEKAGWNVEWRKNDTSPWSRADKDGRWLGALATRATLETDDPEGAVEEWERITGQNASDQGCNCCGEPHYFSFEGSDGKYRSYETEISTRGYWS